MLNIINELTEFVILLHESATRSRCGDRILQQDEKTELLMLSLNGLSPLSDATLLRSGATIVVVVSSSRSFSGNRQDARSGRRSRRRTPVTPSDLALCCLNGNGLRCWNSLVCRCSRLRSSCLCFPVMSSFLGETGSLPLSCSCLSILLPCAYQGKSTVIPTSLTNGKQVRTSTPPGDAHPQTHHVQRSPRNRHK